MNQTLTYPTDYDDGTIGNKFVEYIDEDIEKKCINKIKSDKNKLSLKNASFEIFNGIIQIDFIAIPIIFFLNGFIPSLLVISFIYFLQMNSLRNVLNCKKITSRYTLTVYGQLCFDLRGKYFVQILLLIKPVIICCISLLVCNKIFINLFYLFLEFITSKQYVKKENLSLLLISAFFFILYWKNKLVKKEIFKIFYIITFVITIINSIFYLLYCILMKKINMTDFNNINLGEFHFNKIIKSIGICLFIFCYQSKIFKVYLSLRRRNNIEMKNSVHFGILSSILLISFIGFSNSFNIKNNNFEDLIDKLFYDYNNYVSIFLKILIIIQLIFFMILSSFYLITSSIYLKKKINSLIKDYSNKYIIELEKTDNEKKLKEEEIDKRILIIDVIIFVFYIFFTLYFKNISSIIYLIGILSSNCLSILLPSFFFLFLKKEKFFGSKYLLEKLNLVIGFFFIISSLILFFLNFRNKEKIEVNPKK